MPIYAQAIGHSADEVALGECHSCAPGTTSAGTLRRRRSQRDHRQRQQQQ